MPKKTSKITGHTYDEYLDVFSMDSIAQRYYTFSNYNPIAEKYAGFGKYAVVQFSKLINDLKKTDTVEVLILSSEKYGEKLENSILMKEYEKYKPMVNRFIQDYKNLCAGIRNSQTLKIIYLPNDIFKISHLRSVGLSIDTLISSIESNRSLEEVYVDINKCKVLLPNKNIKILYMKDNDRKFDPINIDVHQSRLEYLRLDSPYDGRFFELLFEHQLLKTLKLTKIDKYHILPMIGKNIIKNTNLTSLKLETMLRDPNFDDLMISIHKIPLNELVLSNKPYNTKEFHTKQIYSAYGNYYDRQIDINAGNIGKKISNYMFKNPHLISLGLNGLNLNKYNGIEYVMGSLYRNTSIKNLTLKSNNLTNIEMKMITDALRYNNTLTYLNLSNNWDIDKKAIQDFTLMLKDSNHTLQEFILPYEGIMLSDNEEVYIPVFDRELEILLDRNANQ